MVNSSSGANPIKFIRWSMSSLLARKGKERRYFFTALYR